MWNPRWNRLLKGKTSHTTLSSAAPPSNRDCFDSFTLKVNGTAAMNCFFVGIDGNLNFDQASIPIFLEGSKYCLQLFEFIIVSRVFINKLVM